MTPLPTNPTVLALTDETGNVLKTATNVAPDLLVVVTNNPHEFADGAAGLPFQN